jgi:hypothetical protein
MERLMPAPDKTPVANMSDAAIEAILAAGGVSDNSAQLHVHVHAPEHEEPNHLCVMLVGTANAEGQHGLVMFCDMHHV